MSGTAVVNSAVTNLKPTNLLDRERFVLTAVATEPCTVDEFLVRHGDLYVNQWAPTFTHLKDDSRFLATTGERRVTRRKGSAAVHEITELGMENLQGCGLTRMVATTPMRCFQPRCDGEHHYMRRDHLA